MTSSIGAIHAPTLSPPSDAGVSGAKRGSLLAMQRGPAPPTSNQRGIASLTHPEAGDLLFRTNPNEITWSYTLNTKVENTYGGRVIQILSTKIDDLTVKVDCGWGGWDYAMQVCTYMRNLMVKQRNGHPATFEYTTRNWKMNVFALSIPFQDEVQATVRELEIRFKVQQDISGTVQQASIGAELSRLQDGIGGHHDQYNTGTGNPDEASQTPGGDAISAIAPTNLLANLGALTSFSGGIGTLTGRI